LHGVQTVRAGLHIGVSALLTPSALRHVQG
jgi:hypothetical protein